MSRNRHNLTGRTYGVVMAFAMSERPACLPKLALKFKFCHCSSVILILYAFRRIVNNFSNDVENVCIFFRSQQNPLE